MANEKRLIDVDKAKKDFNLHFGGVSHAVIANRILDEQPTVDHVEVVHGRWIPVIDRPTPFWNCETLSAYKCSICGRYEDQEEPYCNCGAKMDGERKDNERKAD